MTDREHMLDLLEEALHSVPHNISTRLFAERLLDAPSFRALLRSREAYEAGRLAGCEEGREAGKRFERLVRAVDRHNVAAWRFASRLITAEEFDAATAELLDARQALGRVDLGSVPEPPL